jgi:RNA polymerase sigma-70 factor (ECF subfamily)
MDFTGVMNDALLAVAGARSKSEAGRLMDEETFRAFYERTSRAVWVYLARVTGDRHLADDLLQETYYRFYKAGAAHSDEGHRRNSLFCIATNIARDTHRRNARHPIVPLELNEDASHESTAIDTRIAERFQESTDLWRAMAQLKPVQREMLWLAYALGSTHAEIAEIVGVKGGSVKILLFRARRKLAALLGRPA